MVSVAVGLHPSVAQSGGCSLRSVNCFVAFFVFSLFGQLNRLRAMQILTLFTKILVKTHIKEINTYIKTIFIAY